MSKKQELSGVKVTIQRVDRLKAITELSVAIRCVAEALRTEPEIVITDNTFSNMDKGIVVDTLDDVSETMIYPE